MPRKRASKAKSTKAKSTKNPAKAASASKPKAEVEPDTAPEAIAGAVESLDTESIRKGLKTSKSFSKSYEIFEEIGRGQWGFVCKARELATNKMVAVKIQSMEGGSAKNFLRVERNILFALQSSPYVPELIDFFKNEVVFEGDKPKTIVDVLVMELLDTCSSFESLLERVANPLRTCAAMLRCLQSIHRLGVVHADLSLGNFMHCAPFGVKLLDFGSSYLAAGAKKLTLGAEGTVQYTSAAVDKHNKARFADDAEAAVFVLWRMMLMKPLPWVDEADDNARSKMKLKPKGMPQELLFVLEQVRGKEMPDYDAICVALDKTSVAQPDRKVKEYSKEKLFRIDSRQITELKDFPFLSEKDIVKLQEDGVKDKASFKFRFLVDLGADDMQGPAPEIIERRKVVLENYLVKIKINRSTARKLSEIFATTVDQ